MSIALPRHLGLKFAASDFMAEAPKPTATRGITPPQSEGMEPVADPMPPTPGAPDEPAPVVVSMPVGVRNVALTIIASLAGVATLNYAQPILIPLVLGILIAYAFERPVSALARMKIPRAIGAGIVVVIAVGVIAAGVWACSEAAFAVFCSSFAARWTVSIAPPRAWCAWTRWRRRAAACGTCDTMSIA